MKQSNNIFGWLAGAGVYIMLLLSLFEPSAMSLAIPFMLGVPVIHRDKGGEGGASGSGDGGEGAEAGAKGASVTEPTDPKKAYRQVTAQLKSFMQEAKGKTEQEIATALEKFDSKLSDFEFNVEKKLQSMQSEQDERHSKSEHTEAFRKAFYRFAKGDLQGLKADVDEGKIDIKSGYHPSMKGESKSENLVRFDIASTGVLLLPAEMSSDILRNAIETTPIARLVKTTQTDRPHKIVTLRTSTPGINWVEEEGTTPKGKIAYRKVTLTPKKAAARYGATIENEQDSAHDLYGEMRTAYQEDFNAGIGNACLSGDGNGKPNGMIGKLTGMNSGAVALTSDMLIQFVETIQDVYQQNAQWLFTRQTRAYIRSLLVSSEATQYLWEPDFTRRSPTLLLGAPINIAAQNDMAGRLSGDFTAGQVPILYGNFEMAYELTTHTDMYMIDDPYTESAEWVRNLNIMSRVDGQPTKTEAAAELRITSS